MRVVSFKADERIILILEALSKKKNMTKSELIRRAILEYAARETPFESKRMRVW